MTRRFRRSRWFACGAAFLLAATALPAVAQSPPQPDFFWPFGTVQVGGENISPEEQLVIAFVNGRDKPLALYVFAKDGSVTDKVLERTSSGGVCVNATLYHAAAPELSARQLRRIVYG